MGIIVCATDFSKESTAVVATAVAFSKPFEVPLQLFHLFDVPPAYSPDVLDEETIAELRRNAERAMARQADTLRSAGVVVQTAVEYGAPHDIAQHARSVDASLLVVGTHGRKGAARFVLGSVAEQTIRKTPCPIVVVPSHIP